MKRRAIWMLALVCSAADAQIYRCSADDAGAGLSSAELRFGLRGNALQLHGDVDQIKGGTNIHFDLPDEAPRWLVCQYGGQRVEGTATSGPAVIGGREKWIQLDSMVTACDLAIREARTPDESKRTWTAAATCKRKEPPPPDLV
jgi:hypothetical protein